MAAIFLWHQAQGVKLTFCTTMFQVASRISIGNLPNWLQPGAQQHNFLQAFELSSLSANIRGKWPPCERGPYCSETLRGCEQSIHHLPSLKQDLSPDDIMLLSVCSWSWRGSSPVLHQKYCCSMQKITLITNRRCGICKEWAFRMVDWEHTIELWE